MSDQSMTYIKAVTSDGKEILINPDKIVYITEHVGISGSTLANSFRTEIRYMTCRLDVAYSKLKPQLLERVKL